MDVEHEINPSAEMGILTRPITAEITMAARAHWIIATIKFIVSNPAKKMNLSNLRKK